MIFKKIIPILLLFTLGTLFADEETSRKHYLHVSTNPSGADLYVGSSHPDFSKNPDYRIPAVIGLPLDKDQVLITLFRPDFKDTSIKVTLSPKDTSFLIVSLTPAFDEVLLEEQQADLRHRNRRNFGHRLLVTSIVPLAVSAIAAGIAAYEIDKADECKKNIENTLITTGDNYRQDKKDFKEYRDNAKTAKKTALVSLVAGGLILSVGLFLSF
ncbi:MAG: hypothetical protein IKS02_06255 [Fibrobacter sp.]|jgi:hypothetical protein|nr:hypothetical protein [Fibrobacter sp.]